MSKTIANILDFMGYEIGDYLHSTVTTALAASAVIVDTTLANLYGGATDNYYKDWWVKITSLANSAVVRLVSDYVASTKTLTVQGGNFASDGAGLATYELHRYDPAIKLRAINRAARDVFPLLSRAIVNRTLITGNWLPNSSFEDWAATTKPDFYAVTNATASKNTTLGLGGSDTNCAYVTASADNGYMYISSDEFRSLLDLAGQSVDFKCWVYPQVANDARLVIYTEKPDGTTQTLTDTITTYATKWNFVTLTSQTINTGISYISFRFKIGTNTKTAYFDNARVLTGNTVYKLVLPTSFNPGIIKQANVQVTAYQKRSTSQYIDPCDDIGGLNKYDPIYNWNVFNDGTYSYLRVPALIKGSRIELKGLSPLENTATADTNTIAISDPYTDALVYKACSILYQMIAEPASMSSKDAYDREAIRFEARYRAVIKQSPQPKMGGSGVRFV